MTEQEKGGLRLHLLTVVVVGGALLFSFVLYFVLAFFHWLFTHPSVLVYTFLVLVVVQSYWLLHAYLRSRYVRQRKETA